LNLDSKVLKRDPIIFTGAREAREISSKGAKIEILPENFELKYALSILYTKYKINSVLVEGGANLVKAFMEAGMVDEFQLIESEKVFGSGLKLFDEETKKLFENSFDLTRSEKLGNDTLKIYRKKS